MAKETAHQLGTPISSLMAWMEHLKSDPDMSKNELLVELEKDIEKLQMITERFSSIGSQPVLKEENVGEVVLSIVDYLRARISSKVHIDISIITRNIIADINAPLFQWVIGPSKCSTSMPLIIPSVLSMAMVRTLSSPRCC